MRLKTFRAKSMAEALAAVKSDLGKDAVILRTRSFKQGTLFGLGGRTVVEITASDDPRALSPRDVRTRSTPAPQAQVQAQVPSQPAAMAPVTPSAANPVARAYGVAPRPAPERGEVLPVAATRAPAAPAAREVAARALGGGEPAAPGVGEALRDELAAIKRMVGQVLQSHASLAVAGGAGASGPAAPMPDALLKHYCRLIESEVARELADEIIGEIRDELSPAELSDEGIVRTTLLRRLESLIPVEPRVAAPERTNDGRPLTIALIGPTGVGKTTTIAKLAASYKLRHGKRVGLITSDTYRIAAVDQLRTYANIIGVPLKVALTPEEMTSACQSLAGCDVVLIDTAGRSPHDEDRLTDLAAFLDAARPHQTHLVLSSVVSQASLMRTAERFGVLSPTMVIFTKLDEAANFGVLVNVASRLSARLSYVTTGQEVPDDIEPGRADRLARLVLDGMSERVAGVPAAG